MANIFDSLRNSEVDNLSSKRENKKVNILQDLSPQAYLKDLYENCPNFEESVPEYGSPKSNWLQMTSFIINNSSDEVKKKWSMAQHYIKMKEGTDNLNKLIALSKANRGEILDREPQFPFHYQTIKETKLRKMELDHQQHKDNMQRTKLMQVKLKKWKSKQESKVMKDLRGKNIQEVK